MLSKKVSIEIDETLCKTVDQICKQYSKESKEIISREDCIRISIKQLKEEVDELGIGKLFWHKRNLGKKNIRFGDGKGGSVIGW